MAKTAEDDSVGLKFSNHGARCTCAFLMERRPSGRDPTQTVEVCVNPICPQYAGGHTKRAQE